jgi:integrase
MPQMCKPNYELCEKNKSLKILKNRMIVREGKSEQTLRRYLEGIVEFARFMEVDTPDQALEKFSKAEDRTGKLDQFIDYMLGKGRSPIDIKALWHGTKKWLICNRINNIDWAFISRPQAVCQIRDRIPTVDELRLILDNKVCLRDKAFYLVIASAGFRMGTAMTLKVKDYEPIEELGKITVESGYGRKLAKGKQYFTFITPEARRILEEYLKLRGKLSPEAPLFAKEQSNGMGFEYSSNVSRQWTILVKKAGLLEKIPGHKNHALHGHSLRKFFQTHAKLSGCRADFVDFWMGHNPTGSNEYLNDSYFRPDLKEHLAEYRKAVLSLTVFDTGARKDKEIEELRERMMKLENVSKPALETLLKRLDELEKQVKNN